MPSILWRVQAVIPISGDDMILAMVDPTATLSSYRLRSPGHDIAIGMVQSVQEFSLAIINRRLTVCNHLTIDNCSRIPLAHGYPCGPAEVGLDIIPS